MSHVPTYEVEDMRTSAELLAFAAPMPSVTLSVKRLLEKESTKEFARLLPALAYVTGKTSIALSDIVHMGGGSLTDKYVNAEKVLQELCGKSLADGNTRNLDHSLHTSFYKWRQLIIEMHMASKVFLEHEMKTDAQTEEAQIEPLAGFEKTFGFRPEENEYCGGVYAKAIDKMGLSYNMDSATDWRRAKPASGRRGMYDESDAGLAEKLRIGTGKEAKDAFLRKNTTILLMTGQADISASGFTSGGHGKIGAKVSWVTYADVRFLSTVLSPMDALTYADAAPLLDDIERDLKKYTSVPFLYTLSNAYHTVLPGHRTVIVACSKMATPPKPRRQPRDTTPHKPRTTIQKPGKPAKKPGQPGKKPGKPAKKPKKPTEYEPGKRYPGGNPTGPPCHKHAKVRARRCSALASCFSFCARRALLPCARPLPARCPTLRAWSALAWHRASARATASSRTRSPRARRATPTTSRRRPPRPRSRHRS